MKEEIIIASSNKGKIKEAQEILTGYKVVSIKEIGIDIDVKEDKETFEGNAIKKASEISKYLKGKKCIADDSGIEIEYLNGFPGVYTKRWHIGTDRERNLEIIKKMEGVPKEKRKVKWINAIALADSDKVITAVATLEGYVAESVRGDNGFGFDEIFELENGKTRAELSDEEKLKLSARKDAFEMLGKKINNN